MLVGSPAAPSSINGAAIAVNNIPSATLEMMDVMVVGENRDY